MIYIACKKSVLAKESIKFRLCTGKFQHKCFNIEKQQFLSFSTDQLSTWVCPTCSNVTRRVRSNDNTLVRQNNLLRADDLDSEINTCRRAAKAVVASSRPRNILMTFSSPRVRDMVLSAVNIYKKAHSHLKSTDLDIPGKSCRVLVAEHLSPEL